MRILVVAGIPVGAVVAGIGSRLAMLLLRLTSPDAVRGVRSDDGFRSGRFTLAGTYTCWSWAPQSVSSALPRTNGCARGYSGDGGSAG